MVRHLSGLIAKIHTDRKNMAIVLDRLTVKQLQDVIADAEVLLKKRREQQARAEAEARKPAPVDTPHRAPTIQYRLRPSARD